MTEKHGEQDKLREQSSRGKRLAGGLTQPGDREKLLQHAHDLEREAEALEQRSCSGKTPPEGEGEGRPPDPKI